MVKLEQALVLDPPSELRFSAPFNDVKTVELKLTNPTAQHICFKLKTTAPKTYCVRPNSGIISPQETVVVAVMLQPIFTENPENMKHKFMVQSLVAPGGKVLDSKEQEILWRETPGTDLMNSKVKCVFDVESSSQLPQQQDAESGDMHDAQTEEVGSASEVSAEVNQNASPKVSDKLKKARDENKILLAKVKNLRMENSSYKEEQLRWRRSKAAQSILTQSATEPAKSLEMCQDPQDYLFTTTKIIVYITVLFCGMILGMKLL